MNIKSIYFFNILSIVLHSTPPPSLFAEMSVDTGPQIWDCINANLAVLIGKECGNKAIGFVVALWKKLQLELKIEF
jgi:hypothetical protein